jgi:hypothetical protein
MFAALIQRAAIVVQNSVQNAHDTRPTNRVPLMQDVVLAANGCSGSQLIRRRLIMSMRQREKFTQTNSDRA